MMVSTIDVIKIRDPRWKPLLNRLYYDLLDIDINKLD